MSKISCYYCKAILEKDRTLNLSRILVKKQKIQKSDFFVDQLNIPGISHFCNLMCLSDWANKERSIQSLTLDTELLSDRLVNIIKGATVKLDE